MKRLREPVNGLTHLAGAVLAVGVLALLVCQAIGSGSLRLAIGVTIFGVSLIALYTASALYHLLPLSLVGQERLRRLDHMMIFVLIAGSYTPVCLTALRGGWRWGLLALIWALAAGGILLKLCWMGAPLWLSTGVYCAMGWTALVAAPELFRAVPLGGMLWFIAGGVIYTLGALIFALGRPNPLPGRFGSHELWHLFVLGGSACHVWAMIRYITPLG
jgi:hemolysin III